MYRKQNERLQADIQVYENQEKERRFSGPIDYVVLRPVEYKFMYFAEILSDLSNDVFYR